MSKNNWFVLASSIVILTGCGGSDDTSLPPLDPITPDPIVGSIEPLISTANYEVYGSEQTRVGSSEGFAIIPSSNNQIQSVRWQQNSGPSLTILANNSQTIGFDVPEAGNYALQANITLSNNQTFSQVVTFNAEESANTAAIRLDHTVTELGKVSLHITGDSEKTIQSITWEQLAGPSAQNITYNDENRFMFFDAPAVSQDAIMQLEATITYEDGSEDSDTSLLTVKNVNFESNGLFFGNNDVISEDMHAYRDNSPYKDEIERCVYSNQIPNPPTCTFNDLPLIGMETRTPSIDDILDRTLVSHQWMGDRFKDFLTDSVAGEDMLALLRGVTAVVISYDVRPSFYWSATGAIYLDANNFWQTPMERDTLNDQPDFRSDFGSDLQFDMFWRYTKNDEYYPERTVDKEDRVARNFANVEASISWLMYHELAHANDFFPPSSWSSLVGNTTPLSYVRNNNQISDSLDQIYPLRSDIMHNLAQVRFRNETPTAVERNYRGTDVEGFFVPDIAPSFYAYFTIREDIATLVERYMMLYRMEAEADVAIIDGRTPGPDDEPLVVWGQRNRISDDSLEDRTVYAVERIYPELGDIRGILQSLTEPVLMRPNEGWFENLVLNNPQGESISRSQIQKFTIEEKKLREVQDSQTPHLHKYKLE